MTNTILLPPTSHPSPVRSLAAHWASSLVIGLAAGMIGHALLTNLDGRFDGPMYTRGSYSFHAVLWLDRLISSSQEAVGWGVALATTTLLLLRERRR